MPVGVSLNNSQGKSIAIHQCTDILQLILGGDATVCANSPAPGSSNGIGCFYYETYCSCSASTWACTNNFCQYTNSCNLNSANELGGCPSQSRTGAGLITNCDTTANTCSIETSGCQSDSDCGPGKAVADVAGATCRGTDCTCYNQACYLKCAQDIDCQEGFACNSGTKLCEFAAACGSNSDCVTRLGDVRATCTAGVCGIPCTQDHDCSPSGAVPNLGKFNGTVCGATGVCESVGCSGNSDCLGTTTEVATFCVAPPAAGPGGTTIAHSAITSGGM
jgi:hypothetical protein